MAKGQLTVRVLGDTKPFQKSVKGVGKSIGKVAKVGAAAFGAVGAAAVAGAFKVADYGDEVAKSAQKAGLAVEPFQELRFAFGQGGVEAATFDTAMQKFNKRLGESATTGGTADDAFASLGVSLRDADGNVREAGDTLDEVLPKLADIESDAERAAVAGDLFGQRAGPELAAALADGTEGIDAAREKAQELGIVMDEDAAAAAEEFTDQWDDIKQSALGFMRQGLTPVMEMLSGTVFPFITGTAIPKLQELWQVFQDGEGFVGGLSDVFSNLFSGGDEGGGLFSGLIDAARGAFDQLLAWLTSGGLTQILTWIMESRQRLFEAAMELFPALLDAAVQFLPQLLDWVTGTMIPQLLQFIVSAVPQLLDAAVTLFNALIDAVITVLPDLISTLLGDVLPQLLQTVLGMVPELLSTAIELFLALVDAILQVLPDILTTLITEVLPQVLTTIIEMAPQLLTAAIEAFFALVRGLLDVLPDLISTLLVDVLPELLTTLVEMAPDLLGAAIEAFFALVDALIETIPELISTIVFDVIPEIVEAIINAVPKILDAGKDLARGLWEGIKSMAGWLYQKVIGWARDVLPGPIADLLDLGSPSKLMAEIGRQSGEGLAIGIEATQRLVRRSAQDLARVAEDGARLELDQLGGGQRAGRGVGRRDAERGDRDGGGRKLEVNIYGDVAHELDEERLMTLLRRAETLAGA